MIINKNFKLCPTQSESLQYEFCMEKSTLQSQRTWQLASVPLRLHQTKVWSLDAFFRYHIWQYFFNGCQMWQLNQPLISHNGKIKRSNRMRVLSRATLVNFWSQFQYADSEVQLTSLYDEAKHASWKTPQDIKAMYRSASIIANNRVIFNIHGNKYRLVIAINHTYSMCYVLFVGTHAQYDKIDVATVWGS